MELSEPQSTKQRKINERYYGFFSVHFVVVVVAENDEGRKETKRKDKKMKMSTNNVFSKGEIIKP